MLRGIREFCIAMTVFGFGLAFMLGLLMWAGAATGSPWPIEVFASFWRFLAVGALGAFGILTTSLSILDEPSWI